MRSPVNLAAAAAEPRRPTSEQRPMSAEMVYRRATSGPVASVIPAPRAVSAPPPPATASFAAISERLRLDVTQKFSALQPPLNEHECLSLASQVLAVLGAIIRETGRQLRPAIAGLIDDLSDADRLALLGPLEPADLPVDEPLLRLLPLLSGDELMAVIATSAATGPARLAVGRPRLPHSGAAALARAARPPAIGSLLTSGEAATREATLDALIAREIGQAASPDVLTPVAALPPRVARALVSLVVSQMLATSGDHPRVRQGLRDELRTRLDRLLAGQFAHPCAEPSALEALGVAHRLRRAGALGEAVLSAAARRGESRLLGAMLSVAASVPVSAVDRAVSLRSAKGLISLIWRAGFSMALAAPVQGLLARLPPGGMLLAGGDGGFPLSVEEMRWHLEFLSRVGR